MSLKCLRGFFQGLIHGSLINYHIQQLIGLIFLDITFILVTTRARKLFTYRLTFVLTLAYMITFLSFDITLLLYTY